MSKRLLSFILLSFILIITISISACSRETLNNTTTPISTSTPAPATAPVAKTPPSTSVTSSKPSVLPGDTVIARSASFVNYNLEDLIKHTDTAVIGKVTAILPAKQDEKRLPQTYFYTNVIIQPERYLYGKPQADRIAVRVDGGRIGNIAMTTGDAPEFILGEECTVFLARSTSTHTVPEGFSDENYYGVWADCKYYLRDGILVSLSKEYPLSDVEQEIAKLRKNE
jgi:hypothetical protein